MNTFNNIWRRVGGRKLIAMMLGIGATILLAFYDKLDGNAVTAILGLTAAFSGGNVAEHILASRKATKAIKEATDNNEPEPEPRSFQVE